MKFKGNDTNKLIYKINGLTDIENKLMVTKGDSVGAGRGRVERREIN